MPRSTIPLGINAAAVSSIPDQWSKQWFRGFITNYMQSADVRNTNAGPGISITPGGNLASPGTVALTAEITDLVNEPYLLAAAPSDATLTDYRTIANGSGIVLADGGAKAALTVSLASIGNGTVLGNVSGGLAAPVPIGAAQLTTLINTFTTLLSGAVPAPTVVAGKFLSDNGSWETVVTSANPTAQVGLTAVDGTATTYMTSDSAPALSQAITPVWTGAHVFDSTIVCGAATGGAQAAGTINAVNLYVNGVAVSTAPGANPTGSVGLAAVNGVATTFMRSDAAPALNQAIAPTWTGIHTFDAAAIFNGPTVTINAVSGQTPLTVGWISGQPSILAGNITCDEPAATSSSGAVNYGGTTATTATAGTHGAVPAQVAGYIIVNVAGTIGKIPYFAN